MTRNRRQSGAGTGASFLIPRADSIPVVNDRLLERVPVFRDRTRRRARGLSWTTDRERAEFFARGGRFGTQADPVIASAEVAKVDLFFVSTARKEDEVVLDPYAIRRLRPESNLRMSDRDQPKALRPRVNAAGRLRPRRVVRQA